MTAPSVPYHRGIWDTLLALDDTAAAIRARPDGAGIRQQAAAEALEAFSQAFRSAALPEPRNAVREALGAISALPGDEGEVERPECAGRLRWSMVAGPWQRPRLGACEVANCLRWMM